VSRNQNKKKRSRNQQLNSTTNLPVELAGLLKHAGIDGKKLTWDLQVNSSALSVKLMWIKAAKPVEKNSRNYQPGPEKEAPLTFHQEKKRPTHGPVEGEKGSRW
jgi:hypothetical protein